MKLIKADFTRFFVVGFALGALLVFGTMHESKDSVVPVAHAATAE